MRRLPSAAIRPLIDAPAPHDKPEIVRAFIRQKLTDYVAATSDAAAIAVDGGLPTGNDIEPRQNLLRPSEQPARPITPHAGSRRNNG